MSIGNTNFITLDSIAEIQDIVNGDYLFTVSNGVIYKLDFQNLILTPDNVDFYTTIESLSAQVVSLTNAFSAVNSQINSLSSLDGVGSLVHEMSANWTNTHSQVQGLSADTWLPIGSGNVQSGSLISYVGGSNSWEAVAPGLEGDTLQILENVPQFSGASAGYKSIFVDSKTYRTNLTKETSYVDIIPVIKATTGGQNYGCIGITWNVSFNGGEGDSIVNKSALYIEYGDGRPGQVITGGSFSISGTVDSQPINFFLIPQANFGNTTRFSNTPGGTLTKNRELGEFSALGADAVDYERPFDVDPLIITNVIGSKIDAFTPLLGGQTGGVPSKWTYSRDWANSGSRTGQLWDSASTFLKIYGTPN